MKPWKHFQSINKTNKTISCPQGRRLPCIQRASRESIGTFQNYLRSKIFTRFKIYGQEGRWIPSIFLKAKRALTVVRSGFCARQYGGRYHLNVSPIGLFWQWKLRDYNRDTLSFRSPPLYRAHKLMFPLDFGDLCLYGTISSVKSLGSMWQTVGLLTQTMFNEERQHQSVWYLSGWLALIPGAWGQSLAGGSLLLTFSVSGWMHVVYRRRGFQLTTVNAFWGGGHLYSSCLHGRSKGVSWLLNNIWVRLVLLSLQIQWTGFLCWMLP